MKKITLIFVLFFLSTLDILSQNYKYAWISGIYVDFPSSKNDLQNIVNDINNKKDISFIIITGSITKNNKNTEFDSTKSILDGLTAPYYIIPGINDTKLNIKCREIFKDLWKDEKFAFSFSGNEFIGINSGMFMQKKGHFSVEDLHWLDSVLLSTPATQPLYFYSNYPGEPGIDNLPEVVNRLSSRNVKALMFSYDQAAPPANIQGIPAVSLNNTANDKNGWNYTVVDCSPDTLRLYKASAGGIEETPAVIATGNLNITKADSVYFVNYSAGQGIMNTGIKSEVLWQMDLQKTLSAPLLIAGNNIIAITQSGYVNCFDLNGSLIWQNKCGESVISKPVYSDSTIVIGTTEGDLISMDIATGKIIQTLGLNEPVTSQLITLNGEYNGNKSTAVIAGTSNGSLFCYDIATFEMIWENHSARGTVASQPLLINNRIIFTSDDGYLYCIDAKSGIINWKYLISSNHENTPVLCSPVSNGKEVFVASPDKNLLSIDLLLGRPLWQKNNIGAYCSISIALNNEDLYVKGYKDNFLIVSAKNGKILKNIKTGIGIDETAGNIVELNKNLLFGSCNGKIYVIDKNYKCDALLYLGTGEIKNIYHIMDNIFAASNIDGKFIVFKI